MNLTHPCQSDVTETVYRTYVKYAKVHQLNSFHKHCAVIDRTQHQAANAIITAVLLCFKTYFSLNFQSVCQTVARTTIKLIDTGPVSTWIR